jgi:glycosyltransferase involved in cell wall biosynthesis
MVGSGVEPGNRTLAEAIAVQGIGACTLLLGEQQDLGAIYPAADIVTLSSAFGEGFPNVLAEAMCCAVPCVATEIGDSAEIVGETGAIVPPRDRAALAAGWEKLATLGADRRKKLGAAARARIVEHYDLAAIVARYEVLYEALARCGAGPIAEPGGGG